MALKPFLTFTFLFFAPISHVSSIDLNSSDFAKAYLKHYGYLQHADGNIESAMKLFQQSHEIRATASLDAETLSAMKRPRCGVPDVAGGVNLMQRNRSAYALIPGHPKWPFFQLSYVLRNFPDAAKPQLESALDKWSHVSGFTFSENKGFYDHDLSIGFYRLGHGDRTRSMGRAECWPIRSRPPTVASISMMTSYGRSSPSMASLSTSRA
ncbi:metalloendoproteinase 5-MMP-like [Salvia miltiorrhiza]|uniref:metalloendoproteinase 5-MMP-like n=1 Tax=Salvia miltiorrhiza TaxID=226208 RepID=UPI0025ABBC02|nr:metalloendoproteinase 5-MMP-like [Salvia miltiorrhiza]